MEWKIGWEKVLAPVAELDRDRKVTLTVGQLTDALAEALKVVSDSGPTWKIGDKALIEVDVTWVSPSGQLAQCAVGSRALEGFIATNLLKGIE